MDYRKPTGLITTASTLTEGPQFVAGWPRFSSSGSYAGPLPPRPGGIPLIGKNADGRFKTEPTAAYPPAMSMPLAGHLFQSWVRRQCSRMVLQAPVVGTGLAPVAAWRSTVVSGGSSEPAVGSAVRSEPAVGSAVQPSVAAALQPVGQHRTRGLNAVTVAGQSPRRRCRLVHRQDHMAILRTGMQTSSRG